MLMLNSPVLIMPGFEWNQVGSTRPLKVEKPRIRRFLEEFKSTYCKKRNEIQKKQTLSMYFIRWSRPEIQFYNNEMKMYENSIKYTCRLEIPTAATMPNMMRNIPPMTGSGIVIKTALNLPKSPKMIIRSPAVWSTNLLPTWHTMYQPSKI